MAFYDIIMEDYGITAESRYDEMLNEATVLLEGLLRTKYKKKDLEDPEKIQEIIKQIRSTPQSQFAVRSVLSGVLQFIDTVCATMFSLSPMFPQFKTYIFPFILFTVLLSKVAKTATKKNELTTLKAKTIQVKAKLQRDKKKIESDKDKKQIDKLCEKLDKQIDEINLAIAREI